VEYVHGTVDRVNGRSSARFTSFIKPWSSALGSTAQIKNVKGYPLDLIYTVIMERTADWFLLHLHGSAEIELGDAMAADSEGAPACATGHGARQRSYLHDLGEQGVSFYSLLVKQMVHGGLAAVA
jgi:hypothetical protein